MKSRVRRVLLVLLNPRPRWWASVWLWVVLAVPVFAVCNLAKPGFVQGGGGPVTVFRDSNGQISFVDPHADPARQQIDLHVFVSKFAGAGYKRLEAPWPRVTITPAGSPLPTLAELQHIAHVLGTHRSRALDTDDFKRAYMLWSLGRTVDVERRWWSWVYQLGWWPSLVVLIAAPLVWYLRATQAAYLRQQIRRLDKGLCPSCLYDLSGAPTSKCPECGGDAHAIRLEAVKALRIG